MAEVGGDLWRPNPCSKQGQQEQVAQDCVQLGFDCLQGWRLCSLPGQPVLVLDYPDSKKVISYVRWNFLYFNLCPLPLVLSLGTTEKSLALSSLLSSTRYLNTLIRSPRAFSSPG